jgi:hypothetical protein
MKKIMGALATATLLASGLQLAVAPPASAADTKNCVTKKEFKKVKPGMDLASVKAKLGAKGRISSQASFPDGDAWVTYSYRQCGRSWKGSIISISFGLSSYSQHVPNYVCFDGQCTDYGIDETHYTQPYIVTSKAAYWT